MDATINLPVEYAEEPTTQLSLFLEEEMAIKLRVNIPVYRVTLRRDGQMANCKHRIRSSAAASAVLREYFADTDREHFVTLMLDQKNQVIGLHTVSIGSLSASIVHPRETFKAAILANAAAVILGHNHPSGDPRPSREDRAITTRLKEAGALLGVTVLDHIIIGDGRHFSFADENCL